jgi:hypothetical protein
MPPAWQVREYQQWEFIQELVWRVQQEAERSGDYSSYILAFSGFILERIRWQVLRKAEGTMPFPGGGYPLSGEIERQITSFSRVRSEHEYLWYLLFRALDPAVASIAARDYLEEQILHPEAAYGRPATQEIKLG